MSDQTLDDRYRLQQLLGRGGMADVWRAQDLRLDRPVAVKILNASGRADPAALQRLHREARTVARLDHPHIVAVQDVSIEPDSAYLVMELVEGGSVADLLARGPLPVDQAAAIAMQTCDALGAAHAAGIVHRDIKPANLLLSRTGVVTVCDFGIARLAHAASGATLTHPGTVIGTAAYMAPEQAAGDPTGPATDLYALGCVLYALVTGTPLFVRESPIAVLQQHLNQPPAPLRIRRPDVPAPLDRLVGELLAKNPADRPADAAAVRVRLDHLTAAAGTPTYAAGVAPLPTLTMPAPATTAADSGHLPRPGTPPWLQRVGAGRAAIALAAVAAAGVAVVVLVAAAMYGPPERGDGTTGGGASAPTEARSVAATAGPAPARTSAPEPGTPTDQIATVDARISELVGSGQLEPDAAKELHRDLADVGKQVGRERYKQAPEKVDDLRQQISKLRRDGKLDAAGYDTLTADLDALAASLPDGGDDEND